MLVILPTVALLAFGCATTPTVKRDPNNPKARLFYERMPKPLTEITVSEPWTGKVLYRIRGRDLVSELDRIVEFKPNGKSQRHHCGGEANICFLKHRKVYTCWNLAHGTFFMDWFTPETNKRIAAWLASKGVTEFQRWPVPEGTFDGRYKQYSAHRYLQEAQETDGSWGDGAERYMTTAYVLLAFLHYGVTPDEKQYGNCISNGFRWLHDAKPTSASERALALHLLLNLYQMTDAPPPHLRPTIEQLLAELATSPPPQLYLDLLSLTSFPQDVKRPSWIRRPDEALRRLRHEPDDRILRSSEDFLRLSLVAIARFHHCAQCWREFSTSTLLPMVKLRLNDGRFLLPHHSPIRSTAQLLITLGIYYRYLPFLQDIEAQTAGRSRDYRTLHHR